MKFSRLFLLMLVAAIVWSASVCFAAEEIVARVGAVPITVFEWQRQVNKLFPLQGNFHGGISEERLNAIRESALADLIEQAYKTQYALAEELSVPNADVEAKLAPIREKFPDEKKFEAAFADEGYSRYRGSVYRQLLAQKAEDLAVKQKVSVSDADVKNYYSANQKRYMRPRQYQASHILIKVDPSSNAEERALLEAKAKGLAEKAKAGEDFFNLAYYNSDDRSKFVGGKLGVFHAGQTVKEFDEAIQKMSIGEIVGPVKSMYGYHIIKLDDVQEARQLEYDEMAGKIRQQLEAEQTSKIMAKWLEELKNKYPVERFN